MVAEPAAAHALADGDPVPAVVLLGVGAAQRGAPHLGDAEVRACLAGVRSAVGPVVAEEQIRRGRELPRPDGVALLQDYVRGCDSGAGSVGEPDSASATSRA
jgi:hypothetical protein